MLQEGFQLLVHAVLTLAAHAVLQMSTRLGCV